MEARKEWFTKTESRRCETSPPTVGSLVIDMVAKCSPAAALDLKKTDCILRVNGLAADSVNLMQLAIERKPINYEIYQSEANTILTVQTKGLLLGIKYSKSSEALVRDIHAGADESISALVTLWQREDYAFLRQSCRPEGGVFYRLIKALFRDPLDEFMLAVCDIEEGTNLGQARKVVNDFEQNHNSKYTTDINSLVYFYRAKEEMRNVDSELFHDYVRRLGGASPEIERLTRFVQDIDPNYLVESSPNLGMKFDANNELTDLNQALSTFKLQSTLNEMAEDSLQPICLMSTYRANGPYHHCIKAYHAMHIYTAGTLLPLVVITDEAECSERMSFWLTSEIDARKALVPLKVLYDEDSRFAWDLEIRTAPKFVTINRSREIVSEKWLRDDFDYWNLISLAHASN